MSAVFILAANAWMQHPVGYRIVGGKAELSDFWAVLRNDTLWAEFSHTVLAAFVTGAMVVLGVSGCSCCAAGTSRRSPSARLAAGVALVCTVLVMVTGDIQARLMDTQQPMKMAAAEAVYRTQAGASFSLLTIGNLSGQPVFQIRIPHLLSLIATLSWNGTVEALPGPERRGRQVRRGGYVPVLWVTYWSFRLMVGFGFVMLAASAWGLWRFRRGGRKAFELAAGRCGSCGLHRHAVPGQHVLVAVDRDGTPAMDRVRPDEDRGGDLARRLDRRRGGHLGGSCCFTPCSGSSTSCSCSAPPGRPR